MTFHAPQIIWAVLIILTLGFTLARHGQTVERRYNFMAHLFFVCLNAALLYWGGFFA